MSDLPWHDPGPIEQPHAAWWSIVFQMPVAEGNRRVARQSRPIRTR